MNCFKIILSILLSFQLSNTLIYSQNSNWISKNPIPQTTIHSVKLFGQSGYVFGESGLIMKTTNGGLNWFNLQSGTTSNLYTSYFFNVNYGLTAGENGTMLSTTNGGITWGFLNSGTTKTIYSMQFFGAAGYCACDSGMILKTTNSGLFWSQQIVSGSALKSIFLLDSLKGYCAGNNGIVLSTVNGGVNWISQTIGNFNINDVYFTNNTSGYLSTNNGMYKTNNSGNNWIYTYYNEIHKIKFSNLNTGYAIGRNMAIMTTSNGGNNWNSLGPQNVFPPFVFYDIELLNDSSMFIVGTGGYIFKSTDRGAHCQWLGGTVNNFNKIAFTDINTGYILTNYQYLKTTNSGNNWEIFPGGGNNWFEPNFINYLNIAFTDTSNVYQAYQTSGGGGPGFFSYVTGRGGTFGGFYASINSLTAVGNSGIAVVSGSIVRSDNGGSWVVQYSATNPNFLNDISFHNSNTGEAIGQNVSTHANFVLRTTNAGLSWQVQPVITNKSLLKIKLFSNGSGIILCDSGVIMKTTDFSMTWFTLLNNNPLRFNDIFFLNELRGYGIGSTNMFLYTSNGGASWSSHNTGSSQSLHSIYFIDSLNGYIAGDSGTVLKTTNGGLTFISPVNSFTPNSFNLSQNYPNPFNPTTNIKFDLPKSGFVKLTIYDALGREVTTLVNSEMKAGSYNADWDASSYSSGIYVYKLEIADFIETKKMVLIK